MNASASTWHNLKIAPRWTPACELEERIASDLRVDLTEITRHQRASRQIIISEVGLDMTRWNTEKQFASFLGLCRTTQSGGESQSATSLPRAKFTIEPPTRCGFAHESNSQQDEHWGKVDRRLKGRLGAPKAIVAMAHHLARLVYRNCSAALRARSVEKGMAEYDIRFRLQRLKWLKREAKSLDMQLLPA